MQKLSDRKEHDVREGPAGGSGGEAPGAGARVRGAVDKPGSQTTPQDPADPLQGWGLGEGNGSNGLRLTF